MSGFYRVQLIHSASNEVRQELAFENLITNAGMDAIGSSYGTSGVGTTGLNYLAVGSGSAVPLVTDETLHAEVARTNSKGGISDETGTSSTPEYAFYRTTRVFTTGSANGVLTELGFLSSATSGILFNRTLLKGPDGNPITLIKTAQDLLRVEYELRVSAPTTDMSGSITYPDVGSSAIIIRPQGIFSSDHWVNAASRLGAWTVPVNSYMARATNATFFSTRTGLNNPSTNAASSSAPSAITLAPYTASSYTRDVTYSWNGTDGNLVSGLSVMVVSPWNLTGASGLNRYLYQIQFTTPVPKDNTKRFSITLRYSWTRA